MKIKPNTFVLVNGEWFLVDEVTNGKFIKAFDAGGLVLIKKKDVEEVGKINEQDFCNW